MSSSHSTCKELIRARAIEAGASACGFAAVGNVDRTAQAIYDDWISAGHHGEMGYCADYTSQRSNPGALLPGARTVISCAFNYHRPTPPSPVAGMVAEYAWGDDYHYAVKRRLSEIAGYITATLGGECRALTDTAPIRERYWAMKAGIGFTGVNNQLIVKGAGSYFFLGELLWTGEVDPDAPDTSRCTGCMACVRACPGRALDGLGGCDARRCVSYLTIEHRGDLPLDFNPQGSIYGCDVCQRVCPHNAGHPRTALPEFNITSPLLSVTAEEIASMTPSHYKKLTAYSAMRRVPLKQLRRNLEAALSHLHGDTGGGGDAGGDSL